MIHRRKAGRGAAVLAACLVFRLRANLFRHRPRNAAHAACRCGFQYAGVRRPDLDALNAKIDTALEQVSAGDKEEETLALYDDILADISELDTMSAIAGIR